MLRKLIFTPNRALREKYPDAWHRGVFFGEIEKAQEIITDMPVVRDAYKDAGISVTWIGKKAKKKRSKKHVIRDDSGS